MQSDEKKEKFNEHFKLFIEQSKGRDLLKVLHGAQIFTIYIIDHVQKCMDEKKTIADCEQYFDNLMKPIVISSEKEEKMDDYRMGCLLQYNIFREDIRNYTALKDVLQKGQKILQNIKDVQRTLVFHMVQFPKIPIEEIIKDIVEKTEY